LNPVIYAFNTEFREAFLRLLGCRGDNGCFGGWTTSATRVESVVLASNDATGAGKEKKNSLFTTEMGVAYDTGCGAGRGSVTSGVIRDPVRGRVLPTPLTDRRGAVEEPLCDCELDPVRGRGDSVGGLSRTLLTPLTNRRGAVEEPLCDCELDPVRGRGDSEAGLSRTPPAMLTNRRGTITQPEAECDCPTEDCKRDVADRGQRTQMIPSQTF
jgi:hypothetical protein